MTVYVYLWLHKFYLCYLLRQFSTDFHKVWFSRISMKFPIFRLKKKSGIRENTGLLLFPSNCVTPAQSANWTSQKKSIRNNDDIFSKNIQEPSSDRIPQSWAAGRRKFPRSNPFLFMMFLHNLPKEIVINRILLTRIQLDIKHYLY